MTKKKKLIIIISSILIILAIVGAVIGTIAYKNYATIHKFEMLKDIPDYNPYSKKKEPNLIFVLNWTATLEPIIVSKYVSALPLSDKDKKEIMKLVYSCDSKSENKTVEEDLEIFGFVDGKYKLKNPDYDFLVNFGNTHLNQRHATDTPIIAFRNGNEAVFFSKYAEPVAKYTCSKRLYKKAKEIVLSRTEEYKQREADFLAANPGPPSLF